MAVLELKNVSYSYINPYVSVHALKGVSYSFKSGKMYSLQGTSGSGKTTLLSLMSGLDLPSSGEILYEGKATAKLDLNKYRRQNVTTIYQHFNLLPMLTAMENIMYPMELNKIQTSPAREKAGLIAKSTGLTEDELRRYPSMLSGGQQQRVAIARAIGTQANVILADEPTGNLDSENSRNVMSLLAKLSREQNYCVIVVTHDTEVAKMADDVLHLSDGRLV